MEDSLKASDSSESGKLKKQPCGSRYICSFDNCSASFTRKDRLDHHYRTHTGERPFVCVHSGCDKSYVSKEHLKRHVVTAHSNYTPDSIKCSHCTKLFKTSQNLRKHIKRIHEERQFKCGFCEKTFKKHQHLKIHEYEHSGMKPFRCEVENCNKSFTLPSKLKRHQKIHDGYACDISSCKEVCTSWTALRKHKILTHKPNITCETCGRVFNDKKILKQHLACHLETREAFLCSYENCPRYYFFKKNLRQHIRSYHLNKRFKCPNDNCEKDFVNQALLRQHLKLHDPKSSLPTEFRKKRKGKKKPQKKRRCMASVLSSFKPSKEEEKTIVSNPDVAVTLLSSVDPAIICNTFCDFTPFEKMNSNIEIGEIILDSMHIKQTSDLVVTVEEIPL